MNKDAMGPMSLDLVPHQEVPRCDAVVMCVNLVDSSAEPLAAVARNFKETLATIPAAAVIQANVLLGMDLPALAGAFVELTEFHKGSTRALKEILWPLAMMYGFTSEQRALLRARLR